MPFEEDLANSDGGTIFSESNNILRFESCKLNFNIADNNGGAICLLFQSELNIEENSYFTGNQAGHSGGAVLYQ